MAAEVVSSEKKLVVCRRRGRVEMTLPCSESCGVHRRFCKLDGKKCGLVVLPARPLYACSFLVDVLCPFKTSPVFTMLDQCESCENYRLFNQHMEEADARADAAMAEHRAAVERGEKKDDWFVWVDDEFGGHEL